MYGGLDKAYVTYVHIIVEGTVTEIGDVFSNDYKVVAPTCQIDLQITPPIVQQVFNEVFVISQFWGESYFHKMMENMPRLAPFLPFLRQNPDIRIHVRARDSHIDYLFRALGLDPNRTITSNVHGKLVYLPRSTTCGHLLISEGQLLSHEYRTHIEKNVRGDKTWNSVVLIKRSYSRRFNQQMQVENIVQNLTAKYEFRFELFPDNPPPSIEDTMLIFYRARVIIGPHGAGLSNMLFSRPGTTVIEVICNPPNVCYLLASYYLGHKYFGLPSLNGCDGGMDVNLQEMEKVLEQILFEIKQNETNFAKIRKH